MHPAYKKHYRHADRHTATCDICTVKGLKINPTTGEPLPESGSGSASPVSEVLDHCTWPWIPAGIFLQQGGDQEGTALP